MAPVFSPVIFLSTKDFMVVRLSKRSKVCLSVLFLLFCLMRIVRAHFAPKFKFENNATDR